MTDYGVHQNDRRGFIGLSFCPECNNTLRHREDKDRKVLLYACYYCGYNRKADSNCVYWDKNTKETEKLTRINSDIIFDPTLPRTRKHACPKCSHLEAVYFLDEKDLRQYFQSCTHRWTE